MLSNKRLVPRCPYVGVRRRPPSSLLLSLLHPSHCAKPPGYQLARPPPTWSQKTCPQ